MPRKILTAAAAALIFVSQGCSFLHWGGSASSPAPVPQAEDLFKQGEGALAKGNYDEARQKYTSIRERDPEKSYDALVQVRLGDSYYEEARYSEAEVEYRRFLEMHPHNKAAAYVLYQIGMCSFKQMDAPDRDPSFGVNAMEVFTRLQKEYPNNPYQDEAKEKLRLAKANVAGHELSVGRYYYKNGDYKTAVKRLQAVLDNYRGGSTDPEVLYLLADSQIRNKEYDAAKSTLSILYQDYPNNEYALKAKKKLAGHLSVK